MKWHDHYDQHLTTASEAVKAIKSGDRVVTRSRLRRTEVSG